MNPWNDVLSFEDLQTYDNMLIDSVLASETINGFQIANLINNEHPKLIERWIHTFLEWDTCLEFNCCFGDEFVHHSKNEFVQTSGSKWILSYVSATTDNRYDWRTTSEVDTLREAKIIVTKKVSRHLGFSVHLEQDEEITGELYMVINNGRYHGMVGIQQAEAK